MTKEPLARAARRADRFSSKGTPNTRGLHLERLFLPKGASPISQKLNDAAVEAIKTPR